jgi:hypothetical protein
MPADMRAAGGPDAYRAPAQVSLTGSVTSPSSNLWAERHVDGRIAPVTFSVTEQVLKAERHTTFYLACGGISCPASAVSVPGLHAGRIDATALLSRRRLSFAG